MFISDNSLLHLPYRLRVVSGLFYLFCDCRISVNIYVVFLFCFHIPCTCTCSILFTKWFVKRLKCTYSNCVILGRYRCTCMYVNGSTQGVDAVGGLYYFFSNTILVVSQLSSLWFNCQIISWLIKDKIFTACNDDV